MEKFITKTKKLIFAKQTSMISSTLIISSMIIVSRFFGFLRYRALTSNFSTNETDIFFAAFRIPDLIFEILITGALTTTFIPFYIKLSSTKKDLDEQISSIMNIISITLALIIVIVIIFLPNFMFLLTPGYSKDKVDQIVFFTRIILIGQLPFLVLGNFLTGISQAMKMFLIPAIAPVLYNIAIIFSIIFFSSTLHLLAPVLGVVIGAFLFFVVQLPILLKSEYSYLPILKKSKELIQFFRVILPRIFTVIVAQIDATVDLTLTTFLGTGSYTVFYLAQHLQLLPVSVIGIAFGQASLPYLSEIYKENNKEEFKKVMIDSILNLFFITVPITSFLIFARTPIVRLFFGGQKFDWDSTVLTAITLSYFSISLPLHSIYYFITRCYYAIFDSRTPFYASALSVLINALLSVIFIIILKLPVWSLGISFSISISINVLILMIVLYHKLEKYEILMPVKETAKIFFATAISSVIVYEVLRLFDNLIFDTTRTINVFFLLAFGLTIYALLYLLISWAINIKEIYIVSRMLIKAKEYQKRILEIYSGIE